MHLKMSKKKYSKKTSYRRIQPVKAAKKIMDYCCQGATLHGVKYLSNAEKLPLLHRWLWMGKIIVVCVFCIWMFRIFYLQCSDTHTITVINSNTYPIGNIVFPCITVCNVNRVSKKNFQMIANILNKNGIEENEINDFGKSLETLSALSKFDYMDRVIQNHTKILNILKSYDYTVEKIMIEVQQKCDELLQYCFFKSEIMNCSENFDAIKSMEGFCCSFNYWGPGQIKKKMSKVKPQRVSQTGFSGGLTLVLNMNAEDYMAPSKPHIGAIIMISNPLDYPEISVRSVTVESNMSLEMKIEPSEIISSESVSYLPLSQRLCKVSKDAIAKTSVSFQNCMIECKTNAIYNICNCIPYYYPNPDMKRQCFLSDLRCLLESKGVVNSLLYPKNEHLVNTISCDCMPDCSETLYKFEIHQEKIVKSKITRKLRNISYVNKSVISVMYTKSTCILYEKDIFIRWNDIFATYGGLFGLCIGGSILSVIEICFRVLKSLLCTKKYEAKLHHNNLPFLN